MELIEWLIASHNKYHRPRAIVEFIFSVQAFFLEVLYEIIITKFTLRHMQVEQLGVYSMAITALLKSSLH